MFGQHIIMNVAYWRVWGEWQGGLNGSQLKVFFVGEGDLVYIVVSYRLDQTGLGLYTNSLPESLDPPGPRSNIWGINLRIMFLGSLAPQPPLPYIYNLSPFVHTTVPMY